MTDIEMIQPHIDKYKKTKTWRLNSQEKLALKRLYKDSGRGSLNTNCGNCISKALKLLSSKQPKKEESNELFDLSMPDLRQLAKSLDIKSARSKEDIIHNIKNNVKA